MHYLLKMLAIETQEKHADMHGLYLTAQKKKFWLSDCLMWVVRILSTAVCYSLHRVHFYGQHEIINQLFSSIKTNWNEQNLYLSSSNMVLVFSKPSATLQIFFSWKIA